MLADITERRAAAAALRQANQEKDDFLALLGHELRNPLAPIRTAVQFLAERNPSDEERQRLHRVMDRQVRHLVRLVDDLLDVSRVLRDRVELKMDVVDIRHVVELAVEASRPLIDTNGQSLSMQVPSHTVAVRGDEVRLAQMLCNLLNNASKYSDRGTTIGLTVTPEDGHVVIRVRDTGAGIPADILPRIFEPFVQADRSLERSRGGLGIGLTLVRKIAELHGGRVEASSPGEGQGTELNVRLPTTEASALQIVPAAPALAPITPQRILVVDDNEDAAAVLAVRLRDDGHDVRVAHSGRAALRSLDAREVDIVLLDIGMPGMNGYDVAVRIHARAGRQPILVAVTGYGQDSDIAAARDAGFRYHLVKPVDAKVLEETIRACIADARASEA